MMSPTKTWKKAELVIANYFGGQRRGADFRRGDTGKNDVILPGWSIEIKHNKKPSLSLCKNAVNQATKSKENYLDIPVAVIHRAGDPYADSVVVMDFSEFSSLFMNTSTADDQSLVIYSWGVNYLDADKKRVSFDNIKVSLKRVKSSKTIPILVVKYLDNYYTFMSLPEFTSFFV